MFYTYSIKYTSLNIIFKSQFSTLKNCIFYQLNLHFLPLKSELIYNKKCNKTVRLRKNRTIF